MIQLESLSFDEALMRGVIDVTGDVHVAPGVRFIPYEDDGRSAGLIRLSEEVCIREGAIVCSGVDIGRHVIIGHNVILRRNIYIGPDSVISHGTCIERDTHIGSHVRISALTHLTGGCIIEDDVQIGARVVTINDNELRWGHAPNLRAPIFRHGCRVGSGVTLLSGVEIGEKTFVGAGAVVTRSLPPNVLAYGVPAYVQGDLHI